MTRRKNQSDSLTKEITRLTEHHLSECKQLLIIDDPFQKSKLKNISRTIQDSKTWALNLLELQNWTMKKWNSQNETSMTKLKSRRERKTLKSGQAETWKDISSFNCSSTLQNITFPASGKYDESWSKELWCQINRRSSDHSCWYPYRWFFTRRSHHTDTEKHR